MQSVNGDYRISDVELAQELAQHGDIVGFHSHVYLSDHDAGGVVHRGRQVWLVPVAVFGAAHSFAVAGDNPAPLDRGECQPHPRLYELVKPVGIDQYEGSADRRLARNSRVRHAGGVEQRLTAVAGPLGGSNNTPAQWDPALI
ncbi:hypothetical protein [Rhodococcus sp. BP22]|uniref:hypothetical protein n=1 Tax=Rhodococcus sp. BP22 TaxID=2758566 RepID=UPI0016477563|nr:hypothetical protein [Rhodococcus sp. BP22]